MINFAKNWTLALFCLLKFTAWGQDDSYSKCTITYFTKSKIISSKICFDKENRSGKCYVFNKNTQIIYENNLRKFAGHASAHFEFYASGAVKKIFYSDAPDAGIQFYKETIDLDELGNITSKNIHKYPDQVFVPSIDPNQEKNPVVNIATPAEEVKKNQVWVENSTTKKVKLTVNSSLYSLTNKTIEIYPLTEKLIFEYESKINYKEPYSEFKVELSKRKKEKTPLTVKNGNSNFMDLKTKTKRFYYLISN